MIKCKVCGAANSLDSSVCAECGAALRTSRKNNSTDSDKEIFSNTRTEELTRSGEQRIDLFSSDEQYERMRKGAVLEKIYKQEQAMGEVTELEEPPEPEEVKPIVINRQSSSDIVGKKKRSSKRGGGKSKTASKNYKIPQRIIEPVDSQLLGHKNKPQVKNTPEVKNEKAELKASDSVGNTGKKNKNSSSRQKNNDARKKQNSQNSGKPGKQKNDFNTENSDSKNKSLKNNSSPENSHNKRAAEITVRTTAASKPEDNAAKRNSNAGKVPVKDNGNSKKKVKSENRKPDSEKNSVKPEKPVKEQHKVKKASEAGTSEVKVKKAVNNSAAKSSVKPLTESERAKEAKPKTKKPEQKVKSGTEDAAVKKSKKNKPSPAAVSNKKAKEQPKPEKVSSLKSRTFVSSEFTESDVSSNKNLAALAYIGILFLFPLAKSGSSDFCRVHTKQGIAVFIYSILVMLFTLTAVIGLRILLLWKLGLSYTIYNISAAAIVILMLILLLVPVFFGAVSAFSGVYKTVPIVGKFVNKKNRR